MISSMSIEPSISSMIPLVPLIISAKPCVPVNPVIVHFPKFPNRPGPSIFPLIITVEKQLSLENTAVEGVFLIEASPLSRIVMELLELTFPIVPALSIP